MKVAKEVLGVISVAAVSGNTVRLVGQLDRNLYVQTDKVLQAAGGKWNKKEKAHVFDGDAESRIDQIILTGDVVVPKDEYNYFPTPSALVDRLMEIADVQPGMRCLEPSAGKGAIAGSLLLATGKGENLDCVELMPENAKHLRDLGLTTIEDDFLRVEPIKLYDRIVMNPPFAKQADIKHVMHALNFLKAGGLLVSIMGAGVVFRENKLAVEFRDLVEARGGSIEALPEGSFKESGTMVNTVVVTIPG
jgi:phospholipid N-methyltransferase